MKRSDQRRIIKEMTEGAQGILLQYLKDKKIPEDWDGHELRELFFETAQRYRSHIMQNKGNQRRRSYDAVVLTNNL